MTISTSEEPRDFIRRKAAALGFEACGFAGVEAPWPAAGRLEAFIEGGRHGTMSWMETTAPRRAHPRALWREARSAIVLGLNYGPDRDPLDVLTERSRAAISVYAQGRDYHGLIKGRLKTLAGAVIKRLGGEAK